jgi:hypothetical protein
MAKRSTKGIGLVSDVAAYVRATAKLSCSNPKRGDRTKRVISYIRKAAELEESSGLNKSSARKRISALLKIDSMLLKSMKKCTKRATKKRGKR